MIFSSLYLRFRWLQVPTGLLIMLLQRLPVLRLLTQAEFAIGENGGAVLKSAFALAALGAYNSVAGATSFGVTPATPASGKAGATFAISGTVGTAMTETLNVTGAPGTPKSWSVTGTLPAGLSVTGGNPVNSSFMTIAGTPTTAGTSSVTATAWDKTGATGNHASITCTFTITGGAVNTAPAFTTQPQSATVTVGSSTTFNAAASGNPAPTFQWQKAGTNITGATASSYAISNAQTTDAGSYTVVATNIAGTVTSTAATLTVNAVAVAPSITTQPQSATVNAGSGASFSVVASGSPAPTYQWLKGGATIAGATGSTYSIASVQTSDAGSYSVAVSNGAGSVTSAVATLTVQTAPVITTPPQNATVTTGSGVTFTVVASGTAPLSYQWQKGGTNLAGATTASYSIASAQTTDSGNYAVVVTNSVGSVTSAVATLIVQSTPSITAQPLSANATAGSGVSFSVVATGTSPLSYQWQKGGTAIAGATAASYSIASVQASDAGSYTVRVTNPVGSVVSNAATLTVFTTPAITTQPQAISVTSGSNATFSVVAGGSTPLGYQWQKGGVSIAGATSASFTITSAQTSDAGNFTVVVSNSLGSVTSSVATLTVTATAVAPSITTQPQSQSVTVGGSANFVVIATGSAPISYQWQKGGVAVSGATNATFPLNGVQSTDAGNYTVVVTNGAGTVTSSVATLTVNAAPVAPSISAQPQNTSVTVGSAATLTVTASGAAPLSYQWQKGGTAIAGATSASYAIASAQTSDAGSYSVVVSNSVGSVMSSAATLTVNAAAVAPSITTQPQSVTVTVGGSASFTVTASGTAPMSYQWRKGGTAIAGATSSNYTIPSSQTPDAGSFTVVVSNSTGSVTSAAATLTVNPAPTAPTITTQPTSETVATGHAVSFSIAASSSLAATYQWSVSTDGGATWTPLQDNANYSGTATSTLTVKNATAAMNGYLYRCAASNSAGSVNSGALTLSVAVAIFPSPVGLAINGAGTIYVSDSSNNTIQTVNTSWQAAALAGTAGQQGVSDGTGVAALFRQPGGVALDGAGNLYVADTGNSIIRKISSTGVVTTVAGSASNQDFRDGVGTAAWFNSPAAVALDNAGNLYVADAGNAVIRKIAPDGTVSTVAGASGAPGSADGTGAAARFNQPSGIAVDSAGNLYVADTFNQTIRKVTPAGVVTTITGLAGISGSTDGNGTNALFNQPRGLAIDASGSIYVADTANSAIRKVTSAGVVTTIAGLSTVAGLKDGTGIDAWLNQPRDVKIDAAGNLYVADTGNAAIRKITPAAVVATPTITAAPTSSPSTPVTPTVPTPPDAPPPGKSGGGSFQGWFVLGLLALASGRHLAGRLKLFLFQTHNNL